MLFFQMVLQVACLRRCIITLVAFVWFFSTVRFQMYLKTTAREDAKSHWLHLFAFSLLCLFKCSLKLPALDPDI